MGRAAERVAQALEGRVMLSGTQLLSAANPFRTPPANTANLGGDLFYPASDRSAGDELWKTDGTAAGTVLVKDINSGSASDPAGLVTVGNAIFFGANDGTDGYELWKTDGTAAGTAMVKDIVPGSGSSNPWNLTNVNGKLFFTAQDASGNSGLWTSDGTAAGTVEIAQISASQLTNVNGTLFFAGSDTTHGIELWKSDGTPGGTVMVKDIAPGLASSSPADLTVVNSELFFTTTDYSSGTAVPAALWKSDGTAAGTVLVKQTYAANLYPFDGAIYFAGIDAVGGTQFNNLWKSDGTTTGTVQVTEFHTLQTSFLPVNYATLNGTLILAAYNTYSDSIHLYRTDGTQGGTVAIAPNAPVDNGQNSFESTLMTANGSVYFIGSSPTTGVTVYKTDGTAAGTMPADPRAIGQVNPIHLMGQANRTLVFGGVVPGQSLPTQIAEQVYGLSLPPAPTGQATFVRADNSTAGSWQGTYGSDGYDLLDGPANLPAYAQVSAANDAQWNWTWPDPNSDPRALQAPPPSGGRVAPCDYSGTSFTLDVNLTDGKPHQVALYVVDYDYRNRSETVQVSDAGTGQALDTQNVSNFAGGRWLVYDLSGHVTITLTNNSGSLNAVASGLMFDPVVASGGGGATATFTRADTSTLGGWIGTYGTGGYSVIGGATNLPASVQLSVAGADEYTWADPVIDPRAPQIGPGTQGRVAATLDSFSSFSLDLNLTDGQPHQVGFFVFDYDAAGRVETVEVSDATTGAVLDSRTVSNFAGGQYLDYTLAGHLKITFVNDHPPYANAVLSGIFIDPVQAPVTQPPTATASFATADFTTQGNWSGKYGGSGYYLAAGQATLPVYQQPATFPFAEYTYAANTTDPRALQSAPGSASRLEAVDYAPTAFTYNLNLTDGKVHQLAVYIADYDSQNRSETIQFSDAKTGAVLSSVYAYDFQGGQYVIWNVSGDVNIKFTQVSGPNAVASGVFLD